MQPLYLFILKWWRPCFILAWWIPPICIVDVKELWPLSRLRVASVLLADLQRYFTVFPNFVGNEWLSTCCWRTFELSLTIVGLWWQRPEPIEEGSRSYTCPHLSAETVEAGEGTKALVKHSSLLLKCRAVDMEMLCRVKINILMQTPRWIVLQFGDQHIFRLRNVWNFKRKSGRPRLRYLLLERKNSE